MKRFVDEHIRGIVMLPIILLMSFMMGALVIFSLFLISKLMCLFLV